MLVVLGEALVEMADLSEQAARSIEHGSTCLDNSLAGPLHASIATVHGGKVAAICSNLARATLARFIATRPASLTPCSANTFLAKAVASITMDMDFCFRDTR
jgi:hypothetical protein